MSIELSIQNTVTAEHIPSDAEFTLWVIGTLESLNKEQLSGEITIRIVSTNESAKLNETYRHKTGPTNVLSFNYDDDDDFCGDLAICADLVKQEALEQQKPTHAHWAHLTIHGTLHLLGYDHENETDAHAMEGLEIQLLHQLGFENPY